MRNDLVLFIPVVDAWCERCLSGWQDGKQSLVSAVNSVSQQLRFGFFFSSKHQLQLLITTKYLDERPPCFSQRGSESKNPATNFHYFTSWLVFVSHPDRRNPNCNIMFEQTVLYCLICFFLFFYVFIFWTQVYSKEKTLFFGYFFSLHTFGNFISKTLFVHFGSKTTNFFHYFSWNWADVVVTNITEVSAVLCVFKL